MLTIDGERLFTEREVIAALTAVIVTERKRAAFKLRLLTSEFVTPKLPLNGEDE